MKIHSDTLTLRDIMQAADIARVTFADGVVPTRCGSRKRAYGWKVLLRGESRRTPNMGTARYVDRFDNPERAATWDQWGVFLAVLFDRDPDMFTPYDKDAAAFDYRTNHRFNPDGNDRGDDAGFWPADAHGDHTFRFAGVPCQQSCTKCTAVQRW